MISIILAHDDNNGIGIDNKLPWHSPEDLAWFKKHTLGQTVVMGRKTFESFKKPLPKRTNVVLSRSDKDFGVPTYNSIEAMYLEYDNFFVIGGAEVYQQFLDKGLVDFMYITRHHGTYEADTYFTYPKMDNYVLREETITAENTFRIYEHRRY